MPVARKHLIRLDQTRLYHCTSRCVRRAFLCGFDKHSGLSFEHRRSWLQSTMMKLNLAFCIELVGYAIMSNHYHMVLRVDISQLQKLSDNDVIDRWRLLHKLPASVRRFRLGEQLSRKETIEVHKYLKNWRQQLISISKFNGYLNEYIARKANKEDDCTGRFWEGRFHSQAILDNTALLKTLVYVDLNPVRAGQCDRPENADFTSLAHRMKNNPDSILTPFSETSPTPLPLKKTTAFGAKGEPIPISWRDYLNLVDWTWKQHAQNDENPTNAGEVPPIFERLGVPKEEWCEHTQANTCWKNSVFGSKHRIQAFAKSIGQKWCWSRSTVIKKEK